MNTRTTMDELTWMRTTMDEHTWMRATIDESYGVMPALPEKPLKSLTGLWRCP
jgi:hypothetical protein